MISLSNAESKPMIVSLEEKLEDAEIKLSLASMDLDAYGAIHARAFEHFSELRKKLLREKLKKTVNELYGNISEVIKTWRM